MTAFGGRSRCYYEVDDAARMTPVEPAEIEPAYVRRRTDGSER